MSATLKYAVFMAIAITAIWIIGMPIFWYLDKRAYNNGYCKKCGRKWHYIGRDSQGGHGYCCYNCDIAIWISWYKPKDDIK